MNEAVEIRNAFGEAVAESLTSSDWRPSPQPVNGDDEAVAVYEFPLGDTFGLDARFFCREAGENGSELDAAVRLWYRPATRVAAALGLPAADGVPAGISDLTGEQEDLPAIATTPSDGSAVGTQLAELITGFGPAWARQHAAVDALVALAVERQADDSDPERDKLFASSVILGAAGRVGDAQAALRRELLGSAQFVRELRAAEIAAVTQWLAEGADDLPAPARSGRSGGVPGVGSLLGAMGRSVQDNRVMKAAQQRVALQRAGKTRDQLQALYLRELADKDLVVSPLSVETFLDSLEIESRLERTRTGFTACPGWHTFCATRYPTSNPLLSRRFRWGRSPCPMSPPTRYAMIRVGPNAVAGFWPR